jgi:hypothetical protein
MTPEEKSRSWYTKAAGQELPTADNQAFMGVRTGGRHRMARRSAVGIFFSEDQQQIVC